jgi:DNA replication protein DnaC
MTYESPDQKLKFMLKELRLPSFQEAFQELANKATQGSKSFEQYLLELCEREYQQRKNNRINRYLKESKLPLEKSLPNFEQDRLPVKVRRQLAQLITGEFIHRSENILVFGNPGSGKTHLLAAIAQELIYKEYRVLFLPANLLIQQLLIAKRELNLAKLYKKLDKYEVIFIDDIGYVQQNREEMECLFNLFAHRYERKSLMITSNLPFSKWETIFKDSMTTAATIDRLIHHCSIIELNLPSYRLEASKAKIQKIEN